MAPISQNYLLLTSMHKRARSYDRTDRSPESQVFNRTPSAEFDHSNLPLTVPKCRPLLLVYIVRTQPGLIHIACRLPYATLGSHTLIVCTCCALKYMKTLHRPHDIIYRGCRYTKGREAKPAQAVHQKVRFETVRTQPGSIQITCRLRYSAIALICSSIPYALSLA